MFTLRPANLAAALAVSLLGSGCFKSYVAVSFRPSSIPDAPAEVHESARMQELRPAVKVVAVRAPAACLAASQPAATGPGIAARSRTIVEARCDVVLDELERALAARFRVVSWRELAKAEKTAGLAHVAARQVGADVVLVVTDLAPYPLVVTDMSGPGVVLTNVNPDGSPRGKTDLSQTSDRVIREMAERRFPDGGLAGVALQLELTALAGSTGEPVWTYQRAVGADLDGARDFKMLIRGRSGTWRPVEPRGTHGVVDAAAEDSVRARVRTLAQQLARDAVERFSVAG
jgi:hypothetical protein